MLRKVLDPRSLGEYSIEPYGRQYRRNTGWSYEFLTDSDKNPCVCGMLEGTSLVPSHESQAQPEPKAVRPAVSNCFEKSSNDPKSFSICV